MTDTYNTKTIVEYDQSSLALLEAVAEVPMGYDEEGEPPAIVVVVKHEGQTITCDSFEALRRSIADLGIPFDSFCNQFPAEIAEIASAMNGDSRVIRNSPLFQYLEEATGVTLQELVPKVVGSVLIWHETSGMDQNIMSRKLVTKTMELIE